MRWEDHFQRTGNFKERGHNTGQTILRTIHGGGKKSDE